jgi:hypothetical protein
MARTGAHTSSFSFSSTVNTIAFAFRLFGQIDKAHEMQGHQHGFPSYRLKIRKPGYGVAITDVNKTGDKVRHFKCFTRGHVVSRKHFKHRPCRHMVHMAFGLTGPPVAPFTNLIVTASAGTKRDIEKIVGDVCHRRTITRTTALGNDQSIGIAASALRLQKIPRNRLSLAMLRRLARGTEARRAGTQSGPVHDGPGRFSGRALHFFPCDYIANPLPSG